MTIAVYANPDKAHAKLYTPDDLAGMDKMLLERLGLTTEEIQNGLNLLELQDAEENN